MKILFFIIPLLFYFTKTSLCQKKDINIANQYAESNPSAKIFKVTSSIDSSEIILPLYEKKIGFTFNIGKQYYKLLKIDSVLSFRVNYIYLDGNKFTKSEIDSLRQSIINKYNNGVSFLELSAKYNMDGNLFGDTKWFTKNMMVSEFEEAVIKHKKNDIFIVDKPDYKWYHIVLKTYADTYIKTLTFLKVNSK